MRCVRVVAWLVICLVLYLRPANEILVRITSVFIIVEKLVKKVIVSDRLGPRNQSFR
jgi:hypothetical protein